MCTTLLFATTTTEASVLANGIIPITTAQRRLSQAIALNSNSIVIGRPGYYKINASVTFTAPAAGVAGIKLQKNGVDVLGITAETTITTATTEVRTLNINGIIKVFCGDTPATLTLVNSGVATTVQNVSFDIEYIG